MGEGPEQPAEAIDHAREDRESGGPARGHPAEPAHRPHGLRTLAAMHLVGKPGLWTAVLGTLACLTVLACLAPAARAAERPIVYAIVLDGLDGDSVDAGSAPFIRSLISGQAARTHYYREARATMIAQTNSNHASMVTGAYTDRSGIPGNAFAIYAPTENDASCVRTGPIDESRPPTVVSGENPTCLQAPTLFEAIKRQGNPDDVLTSAIFGKAKLGRIFAARSPAGPRWIDHLWAPCTPSGPDYEQEYCADVPIEPITRDRTVQDEVVMDEVVRTVEEGVGPERRRPDFTFVNMPNVDNAGHAFGHRSTPYDTAVALADAEVERLVNLLKARGEWERTVLMLLSDHGHDTTPERTSGSDALSDAGIPAEAFTVVGNDSALGVYLNDRTDPGRFELLARMRQALLAEPGVDEALYREPNPADGGVAHTIDAVHPGWNAAGPRNGDLLVTHRPGGNFLDEGALSFPNVIPGNHGTSFTLDPFFALVSGSDQVVHMQRPGRVRDPRLSDTHINTDQAENVDVAATVMGLFGMFAPDRNAGRFLAEGLDIDRVPGIAKPTAAPRLAVARRARVRSRSGRTVRRRFQLRWAPRGGEYTFQIRRYVRRPGGRVLRFLQANYRYRPLPRGHIPRLQGRANTFRVRSR
jgi:hypothetical protein